VRRGRFRSRAAILALLGAGVLAPTGAAQTPFEMEMDMGGAGFSVSAAVPDPAKTVEKVLQCDEPARCMQDVFEAATPVLEPEPTAPAPPSTQPEPSSSPPAPSTPQPEQAPDSAETKNDSGPSSTKPTRSPNRRASAFEGVSAASNPAVAEADASSLPVQERRSEPLQRRRVERLSHTPEAAPVRGPDLLGPPPALGLPTALEQGLDWNPLLLSMLLGAVSLALLFFLLVAAPQHSLARVSNQLAGRRYDLGLIGAVTLVGVVLGYLVATWVG
jgi:hypothetical protein